MKDSDDTLNEEEHVRVEKLKQMLEKVRMHAVCSSASWAPLGKALTWRIQSASKYGEMFSKHI